MDEVVAVRRVVKRFGAFTALVAASRVVLGLHFPSDVLAAGAIGSALAGLSLWLVPGVGLLAA